MDVGDAALPLVIQASAIARGTPSETSRSRVAALRAWKISSGFARRVTETQYRAARLRRWRYASRSVENADRHS